MMELRTGVGGGNRSGHGVGDRDRVRSGSRKWAVALGPSRGSGTESAAKKYVKGAKMVDITTKRFFSCERIHESLKFHQNPVSKLIVKHELNLVDLQVRDCLICLNGSAATGIGYWVKLETGIGDGGGARGGSRDTDVARIRRN